MADIFISYASEDRSRVEPLAKVLEDQGWSVWWDRIIPTGKDFDDFIEEEISKARCVLVIWTKRSVKSKYVKGEAREALNRGILVPIEIESDIKPPFDFRSIQTLSLINWDGSDNFPGFQKLVSDISKIIAEEEQRRARLEEVERKAVEERKKKEAEAKRKAEEEKRRKEQELKRKAEEERLKKEAEAKRKAEGERKKKEIEERRKIEEERKRKEEEQKRMEAAQKAEEERKQKEIKAKHRADEEEKRKENEERKLKSEEERERRDLKARVKTVKPKPDAKATIESVSSEPSKTGKTLKFGAACVVIVLLIVGIWWWSSRQQVKEVRQEIEKLDSQALNLGNAVAKVDNPEQFKKFTSQSDTLGRQVEGLSEQATRVGLESQLEQLQERLKQVQNQIADKGKEFSEFRQEMKRLDSQALNLENAVKELDKAEQIEEFTRQRNTLSHQVEGLSEQAIKIGMQSQLEQLQNRLERIQIELANKEKELIAARKGPISPQKTITNSITMKFVLIQAGSFTMGSQISPGEVAKRYGGKAGYYKDEQPPHPVEITKPFYLQITEVSQAQWKRVMGDNPSNFKNCGDGCPVERVSWDMAQEFISKLNQMEATNKYRLPTEAEWEYACKAKTETAYSFGDEVDKLGEYAWYTDNSEGQTHPGGKKKPNAWGLYDMHGNVCEWCQDWYGDYPSNSVADPKGPDKGEKRVLRGGSWINDAWLLRSASRNRNNPDGRGNFDGFRVARDF